MATQITLYRNGVTGEARNSLYPISGTISTQKELKDFVQFDHVAVEYQNGKRSKKNFIKSNCVMLDVDNTHTDNPAEWVTLEKLKTDFAEAEFYAVTSRNHNKEKNGKSARPKYHVYFPIAETANATEYEALKANICAQYPYFDRNAKDSARFFFGSPEAEVFYFGDNLCS